MSAQQRCAPPDPADADAAPRRCLWVLHASSSGTSERLARSTCLSLSSALGVAVAADPLSPAAALDLARACQLPCSPAAVAVFHVSTLGDGEMPTEPSRDALRVLRGSALSGLSYAVFGVGDTSFGPAAFNRAARELDRCLHDAGARRLWRTGLCDAGASAGSSADSQLREWSAGALAAVAREYALCARGDGVDLGAQVLDDDECGGGDDVDGPADIEDISAENPAKTARPAAMIPADLREALEKEGYGVVGTHSAVKMCRWTRNAVRGRGLCYKNGFYGIRSHQCMEFSSSIACANKCVFCWRHQRNPVTTAWRWPADDPQMVADASYETWKAFVRPLKGVPDIVPERFEAAVSAPRHVALSLVGESLLYPRLSELLRAFHARGCSTFLVSNAQAPEQLAAVCPVTQLYLSCDAATRETLAVIDRPLHRDYWERFLACLDILAQRTERTVLRLTVVKGWNASTMCNPGPSVSGQPPRMPPEGRGCCVGDTPAAYAALVRRGRPSFIEVKGATYFGASGAGSTQALSMANVPYHSEVVDFARLIAAELAPDYELASEHAHSCCVLLAHKSFRTDDGRGWNTWIDHDRFLELAAREAAGEAPGAVAAHAYSQRTPEWAVFGSPERGTNPDDRKVPHHSSYLTPASS
eukprot:m51a1_g14597 hypothetical protein (645) ;mRNA; f:1169911-1171979